MTTGDGITKRTAKDGVVTYQFRWHETDASGRVRRPAKTFATREGAEDFRRRQLRHRTPATMTVADLIAETLDRACDRLSERTIYTYRARADSMILPHLGSRRVLDLETLDVQRWIDTLVRAGYQPATIHAAVAVLHGVWRDAHLLGIVDRNVVTGVRRPTIRREPLALWGADEVRRFLASVRDNVLYGAIWHTALATGMRPGELRALAWADVDLERRVIHVHRTVSKDAQGREVIREGTKRGRGRAVAIPAGLVAVVQWHRARQAERRVAASTWHDLGLVFDRGDGRWIAQRHWRERQVVACQRAGLPYVTAHQMRHIAATLFMEQGVPVPVVSEILGHSTTTTTMAIYQHASERMHRAAVDELGAALFDPAVTA